MPRFIRFALIDVNWCFQGYRVREFLAADDDTTHGVKVVVTDNPAGDSALWSLIREDNVKEHGWSLVINKLTGKVLSLERTLSMQEAAAVVLQEYDDGENQLWQFH